MAKIIDSALLDYIIRAVVIRKKGFLIETQIQANSPVHAHVVLSRAVRVIDSQIGHAIKQHGLTNTQFGVLDVLYTKGDMTISQLLNKLLATSGNMTVVLKNMEKKGWLVRQTCPSDKRAFTIGLTPSGRQLFETVLPAHLTEIDQCYQRYDEQELAQLIQLLKKFKQV